MRTFIVAVILGALIVPVFAQAGGPGGAPNPAGRRSPNSPIAEDPAKKKAEERAYNDALKRIPASDKKYDPWGNVRELPKH